jgi:Fanconi anemia group M protein
MFMIGTREIHIIADFREVPSGIPDMIEKSSAKLTLKTLSAGDYLVNDILLIERKSKEDFIQSILQKRLFEQCAKLKRCPYNLLLVIEGNPYKTDHKISREAIRGALLSLSVAWQIPVFYSGSPAETFEVLIAGGSQMLIQNKPLVRKGYKPKRFKNNQLFFLQGLPSIGPTLALALLNRFGSLNDILNASFEELLKVKGIGRKKAKEITEFLDRNQA